MAPISSECSWRVLIYPAEARCDDEKWYRYFRIDRTPGTGMFAFRYRCRPLEYQ